jgi:hypothetical protein
MPLIETAALALGSVLAKEVAKGLLGKDSNLLDAAGVLIDLLKGQGEKSLADAKEARKIETLSREIAQRTLKLFESEGSRLDEDDRKRVVAEVAATIASHPLTPQFIVEHNSDPQRVAQTMLAEREPQVSQARLSEREHSLYERMVMECVRGISEVVITTDSFVPSMLGESMRRQETFQENILNAIALRIEQERDEAYMREARLFEQQYRALVKHQFEKFEPFGIREVEEQVGQRRLMSQAYISLTVRDLRHDSIIDATRTDNQLSLWSFAIEEAVAYSPRLVITGVAGGGKSTLVKYLAAKAASDDLPETLRALQGMSPFVLRLRRCPDETLPNVEGWLALEFSNLQQPPEGWIRNQLAQGKAIVMVDGVDELSQSRRESMLNDLKQLMLQYPAARYIVTSRPEALADWSTWREWIEAEEFLHVSIEPMSSEQRAELVKHWFEAFRTTVSDGENLHRFDGMPEKLNNLLQNRPPLGKLAVNPLMCAMVCALYERLGDSLPQRRTDLYDKCIDMALTLRDQQRGVRSVGDYKTFPDSKDLLQHVAAWMTPITEGKQVSMDKSRVVAQMDRWLMDRRITETTGKLMCRYYIERAGLLREPLEGLIEFEHRTFQEYLTAREICADDRLEELRHHMAEDRWREVIVLASGLCNSSQRKIIWKMIADAPDIATKTKLSFILECLEVIGTRATQLEREDAVRQLRGIINLSILSLSFTDVSDVSALAALTNLQSLDLFFTRVSDVSALAALTNLQSLNLWNTGVSDMSVLAALTNLQSLNLSFTGVSDVSALAALTNLQSLDLSGTKVINVSALAALTNLRSLNLSGTGVSDVSALAALTNLQSLELSGTKVNNVSALTALTNLQSLSLWNTSVSDVSALAALTNLQSLDLSYTPVSDMSALAALTNLQSLDLSGTGVSDMSVLAALTNLQSLDLSGTGASDMSALTALTNLRSLNLSGTKVKNLSALTALTNLRSLDLSDTGVNDVSALTALRNLRSLDLSGIDVSDVSVLAALTNLQSLDLRITALNDLSPLFRFACLRKLAVSPEYWSDEMAEQIKRNNPEVKIYVAFSEDYIEAFYE